jgi:hypothetical protein
VGAGSLSAAKFKLRGKCEKCAFPAIETKAEIQVAGHLPMGLTPSFSQE